MADRADWVWMPHAGHLIVSRDCQFHLTTCVGDFIVSTVGEYLPDETVREFHADARNIKLEGRGDARLADFMRKCGYVEVGYNRTYETMVFPAKKMNHIGDECCPWRMADATELEMNGYNDPGEAYHGHLALCEKWSKKEPANG